MEILQQIVNGLTQGAIYALIALGYTMVYGVLRLINFAHGDVYMLGAFAGFYSAGWLGLTKRLNTENPVYDFTHWLCVALIFFFAMLSCAVIGLVSRTLRLSPAAPIAAPCGFNYRHRRFAAVGKWRTSGFFARPATVSSADSGHQPDKSA